MTDACGCGHDDPRDDELAELEPERLWEVSELRFAAFAGVFIVAGFIADRSGASGSTVTGLNGVALALGAWTFVPSTLKRLVKGKIGVGTLMTIAAVGAVILGEVAEAAMLAFLYSISEGLEEYAVARTRRDEAIAVARAAVQEGIEPVAGRLHPVATRVAGVVTEMRMQDNAPVKAGDVTPKNG